MFRATLFVSLALLGLTWAKANHGPSYDETAVNDPAQSRQLNTGPPEFPAADNLDLSFRILEGIDNQGNEISALLALKFARVSGILAGLESDIEQLGDSISGGSGLNLEEKFEELKSEIGDAESFIKGAIQGSTETIITNVNDNSEAIVEKVVDVEHTIVKELGEAKDEIKSEIGDAELFIKGEIAGSAAETLDKVKAVGNSLAGKIVEVEHHVLDKVSEATQTKLAALVALEVAIDRNITEAVSDIKKGVVYVGKKVAENVTLTAEELSDQIADSANEVIDAVVNAKKYNYAAISATGVYIEKAIEESTDKILDKIMDGGSGSGNGNGGAGGNIDDIVDAVEANTDASLDSLEQDLKKFVHERLSPISQGVQYLTERAYANSVGIRFIKKVLKKIAANGCYSKMGNIEIDDEDDLDDDPKELKLKKSNF